MLSANAIVTDSLTPAFYDLYDSLDSIQRYLRRVLRTKPFSAKKKLRPRDAIDIRYHHDDDFAIIEYSARTVVYSSVATMWSNQSRETESRVQSQVLGDTFTERQSLKDNDSDGFRDGTNKRDETAWADSGTLWRAIQRRRQQVMLPQPDKNNNLRSKWFALLFGQLIALLASSMNAASFTLNQHFGLDTQFFQMFWLYLLLSLHLFVRKERPPSTDPSEASYTLPGTRIRLRIPWWIYLIISILDVFPNFMTLLSLRYTSLTSTTLLGSLTVPSTMFFSRHILAKVFTPYHYAGVCLCLAGGILTIWSDVDDVGVDDVVNDPAAGALVTASYYPYVGDLLAVAAALAYGLGDTIAEYSIKHVDREEYLGMLGVYGVLFTGLTFPWLERDSVHHLFYTMPAAIKWQALATLGWYVASVLFYYMSEAYFLVASDATLLNLSLQTSNLWVILFSVVAYQDLPPAVFYLAVALVVTGVFVYEKGGGGGCGASVTAQASNETNKDLEVEPLQSKTKTNDSNYQTIDKL